MVISAQFSKTVARSDNCHSQRVDENERERYAQWNLRFSSLSMGKVNAYLKMKEIEKKKLEVEAVEVAHAANVLLQRI